MIETFQSLVLRAILQSHQILETIAGLWNLILELLRLTIALLVTVVMVTITAMIVPIVGILGAITGLVRTTRDIALHPK